MSDDYGTIDAGMSTTGIQLSSTDLYNLRTAGKWGRFIAIVTLVMMALMILGVLFFGGTMMALAGPEMGAMGAAGGTFLIILYLGMFALYIYPLVKLYQFSTNAIKAADSGSSNAASESFAALGSMYKFMGILLAIVLGFYALMIVLGLLGGAASML